MRKGFFVLFLISVLLLQSGGLILLLKGIQFNIEKKNRVLIKNRTENHFEITFSLKDFKTIQFNAHEFKFKNQMYDFSILNLSDDSIKVLAKADYEEQKVIEKIKLLCDFGKPESAPAKLTLNKLFSFTYLKIENLYILYIPEEISNFLSTKIFDLKNSYREIIIPPPRCS